MREAIDINGTDTSADMLDWCRQLAGLEQFHANPYSQAMHELDLHRKHRTIIVCGAFGLGGTRDQDLEGLRRLHSHLEPGGRLFMDHHRVVHRRSDTMAQRAVSGQ